MNVNVKVWYRGLGETPDTKVYEIDPVNGDTVSQISVLVGNDFKDKEDVTFEL